MCYNVVIKICLEVYSLKENENLYFYQKFVVILGYILFATEWPWLALFMLLFIKDEFIRMHINRLLFCGILNTFVFLMDYFEKTIPFFSINTFVLIVSLVGMIQVLFSSRHQILLLDKIPLIGFSEGKKVGFVIPLVTFIVTIIISCLVRC